MLLGVGGRNRGQITRRGPEGWVPSIPLGSSAFQIHKRAAAYEQNVFGVHLQTHRASAHLLGPMHGAGPGQGRRRVAYPLCKFCLVRRGEKRVGGVGTGAQQAHERSNVRTCTNSPLGFLRPPFSGTFTVCGAPKVSTAQSQRKGQRMASKRTHAPAQATSTRG